MRCTTASRRGCITTATAPGPRSTCWSSNGLPPGRLGLVEMKSGQTFHERASAADAARGRAAGRPCRAAACWSTAVIRSGCARASRWWDCMRRPRLRHESRCAHRLAVRPRQHAARCRPLRLRRAAARRWATTWPRPGRSAPPRPAAEPALLAPRYGATLLGLMRHHGVKPAHFLHAHAPPAGAGAAAQRPPRTTSRRLRRCRAASSS